MTTSREPREVLGVAERGDAGDRVLLGRARGPATVTVSPTLKPYFVGRAPVDARPRRRLAAGRPRRRSSGSKRFGAGRDGERRRAVGDDRLALAVEQRARRWRPRRRLLDARHRPDLSRACPAGIVGGCEKSALTAWCACDRDVDALLRALEQVLERGVDRVREDERARHEGDADDDGEAGQDRAQLAGAAGPCSATFSIYATAFIRSSTPSVVSPAPSWTTSPSRSTTMRSATAAACGVVGDHHRPSGRTRRPRWRSRPSTSSEDVESRLPVGSSANTTAGGARARAPRRRAAAGRRRARTGGA